MKITLKIKPTLMTAKTKADLLRQINYRFATYHTVGAGCCLMNRDDTRIVYNLQKARAKFTQTRKKASKKQLQANPNIKTYTVSTKVRDGGWSAYVYTFKKDFPVNVKQGIRTFSLKAKN